MIFTFNEAQASGFGTTLSSGSSSHRPRLVLRIAFEAGNRIVGVAVRCSPHGDGTTLGETRRLIPAYLETYGPEAPRARA